jgi:hypothetical protein
MIEHENSDAFASAVSRARRHQHDQLERVVREAGRDGICAVEIQKRLNWTFDTADAEIERAFVAGEIGFLAGDEDDANPRFVFIGGAR